MVVVVPRNWGPLASEPLIWPLLLARGAGFVFLILTMLLPGRI